MLSAKGIVENPDTIVLTLTLTMTLGEWKQVAQALPTKWPNWVLASAIDDSVRHFTALYGEQYETTKP